MEEEGEMDGGEVVGNNYLVFVDEGEDERDGNDNNHAGEGVVCIEGKNNEDRHNNEREEGDDEKDGEDEEDEKDELDGKHEAKKQAFQEDERVARKEEGEKGEDGQEGQPFLALASPLHLLHVHTLLLLTLRLALLCPSFFLVVPFSFSLYGLLIKNRQIRFK